MAPPPSVTIDINERVVVIERSTPLLVDENVLPPTRTAHDVRSRLVISLRYAVDRGGEAVGAARR